MIQGVETSSTRRELGLLSLEKRRLRIDLMVAFQSLKGGYKKDGDRLCNRVCCDRTHVATAVLLLALTSQLSESTELGEKAISM